MHVTALLSYVWVSKRLSEQTNKCGFVVCHVSQIVNTNYIISGKFFSTESTIIMESVKMRASYVTFARFSFAITYKKSRISIDHTGYWIYWTVKTPTVIVVYVFFFNWHKCNWNGICLGEWTTTKIENHFLILVLRLYNGARTFMQSLCRYIS